MLDYITTSISQTFKNPVLTYSFQIFFFYLPLQFLDGALPSVTILIGSKKVRQEMTIQKKVAGK